MCTVGILWARDIEADMATAATVANVVLIMKLEKDVRAV